MIKDRLTRQAFYKGKEIKIIELENLSFFFKGLSVLSEEWKIEPFTKLWGENAIDKKITHSSLNMMIYLIYKIHFGKGGDINIKRFKNELLFKNKNPKVFLMESDYLTLSNSEFNSAISYLNQINFININSHNSYFNINNTIIKYCIRLGDYLFETDYCKKSFERNTHYFGDSNSFEHHRAFEERKELNSRSLN